MFCQKCGQEQASESVRYCLRCGFKLNAAEECLRRRVFIIAMYIMVAVCAIFGWGSFTSGPEYMQVRAIITVLAATTFYLLFRGDLSRVFHQVFSRSSEQLKRMIPAPQQSVLPPAQTMPMPTLGSTRVNTAEIVQPPSITEHTTTLLDENKR